MELSHFFGNLSNRDSLAADAGACSLFGFIYSGVPYFWGDRATKMLGEANKQLDNQTTEDEKYEYRDTQITTALKVGPTNFIPVSATAERVCYSDTSERIKVSKIIQGEFHLSAYKRKPRSMSLQTRTAHPAPICSLCSNP